MPSQWDHRADKDLLLTIIESGNLTHIDWQSVSARLRSKDYTFSHEACRQHYQKIRKESRNNSTFSNGSTSLTTPTKAAASTKSTPASKRKNTTSLNNSSSNSNEDDEEDLEATPSAKRQRSMKKEKPEPQDMGGFAGQTAAQFKVEEYAGDDAGNSYRSAVDLIDEGIYAA